MRKLYKEFFNERGENNRGTTITEALLLDIIKSYQSMLRLAISKKLLILVIIIKQTLYYMNKYKNGNNNIIGIDRPKTNLIYLED